MNDEVTAEIRTYSPDAYVLTDIRGGTQWVIALDKDGVGYWKPLPNTDLTEAQVEARKSAVLNQLPTICEISRDEQIMCTQFLGQTFPIGVTWTLDMCCLPCRIRHVLA